MDYYRYNSYSVKARMSWVQKVLNIPVTAKRDKVTVKAIVKFQKENGLSPNGVVCERTYNLLYSNGGSAVSIK